MPLTEYQRWLLSLPWVRRASLELVRERLNECSHGAQCKWDGEGPPDIANCSTCAEIARVQGELNEGGQ